MNPFDLLKDLSPRWGAAGEVFRSYLLLRTTPFVAISHDGSAKDRWGTSLCLMLAMLGLTVGVAWIVIGKAADGSLLMRQTLLGMVSGFAMWIPAAAAVWLVARPVRLNVIVNLVLSAQLATFLSVFVSLLILLSGQPARTDFLNFPRGIGERTTLGILVCRGAEIQAEMVAINVSLDRRNKALQQINAKSFAALAHPPRSFGEVERNAIQSESDLSWVQNSLEIMRSEQRRYMELRIESTAIQKDFDETYGTLTWARYWAVAAMMAIGVLTFTHLFKIVLQNTRLRQPRLVAGVVVAAALTMAFGVALVIVGLADQPPTRVPSEDEIKSLGREVALTTHQLRARYTEIAPFCPTIRNFGLW